MTTSLSSLFTMHPRIAIIGGANTGKSTLAKLCTDRPIYHTDDYAHLPWSEQPLCILSEMGDIKRFLIEGFIVPRVLRKGLDVDLVIKLDEPFIPWSKRQAAAAKAINTWMQDVETEIYCG